MRNQLSTITNAQDRHTRFVDLGVKPRRAVNMHTLGATRQDDGSRILGRDLFGRDGVRNDLGVHLVLTHTTSDELCVLRPEVNN